jgi:hypothetical protein
MTMNILQRIFQRVQVNDAEGRVLRAILSKANSYGKHAKVAYACLAAITGFSVRHVKRLVKSLIEKRRLLRVEKRVLWYCHNAINVYHVVIPWRREVSFEEMGMGRPYPPKTRVNDKGDRTCHPNTHQEENSPLHPARLCTEQEASEWLKPGSAPWYFSQGKTPPWEEGENGNGNGS